MDMLWGSPQKSPRTPYRPKMTIFEGKMKENCKNRGETPGNRSRTLARIAQNVLRTLQGPWMVFRTFCLQNSSFLTCGIHFYLPQAKNEEFYRENVLKTIQGPYNVRKTFQAIRASVLERFLGVSLRFLQFFLHFPSKIVILCHFPKSPLCPKRGVPSTLETQGSRN